MFEYVRVIGRVDLDDKTRYYIRLINCDLHMFYPEHTVAKFFELDYDFFIENAMKFNAEVNEKCDIAFYVEDDAYQMAEWLESVKVINELAYMPR